MFQIGHHVNSVDSSERYIKMCWRNRWIRRDIRYEPGDHIINLYSNNRDIHVLPTLCVQVYDASRTFKVAYIKECDSAKMQSIDGDLDYMIPLMAELEFNSLNMDATVWLPTTRQLRMYYSGQGHIQLGQSLTQLIRFLQEEAHEYRFYETEEQLWMAYIMSQMYNRYWDENNWVEKMEE